MSNSDVVSAARRIRFKEVYGVFVLSPDDVQFRSGSLSGIACIVSDPERRGLLGSIIERLLSPPGKWPRPWNEAETELLHEIIPQLQESGIIETDDPAPPPIDALQARAPILSKNLDEARIAIVGHGMLGKSVRAFLIGMPCGSVTVLQSSSVAEVGATPGTGSGEAGRPLPRPQTSTEWTEALSGCDWVVAAQDCFEPEELAEINKAALSLSTPWSLVCFDGHEGWVGPTFVPGQTACFSCFQTRLFAGASKPKHVFMNPRVKVHRVPSPWSAGPETGAWVSLITSIFALEVISAMLGRSFTFGEMLIVHRLNLTFQRESVLRLPRCSDCSPRATQPVLNVFSHVLSTRESRGQS
jgi:bacteriocin biosynthesis cyclodehydratase domain-containing protein